MFVASRQPGATTVSGPITGFNVAADGSTTPAHDSPFKGANGSLATNGTFLFATDGTNIVSYAIGSEGSLALVSMIDGTANNDTPTGSGVGALSLDRTGSTLYAGEINFQGADNDAFAFFNVSPSGTLSFLANSVINVNFSGRLIFTQDNKHAYGQGCFFLGWDLFGLVRNPDGTLTPFDDKAPSPPIQNGQFFCPGPSTASPAGNFLAGVIVPEGQNGVNDSLSVYIINSDGTLTLVPNSVMTTPFMFITDIEFDPSGNFVAAATNSGVQIYRLTAGTLTAIGSSQDANTSFDLVQWDGFGHLYAISSSAQRFFIYTSTHGVLSAAPGSPYSVANPAGLAVAK